MRCGIRGLWSQCHCLHAADLASLVIWCHPFSSPVHQQPCLGTERVWEEEEAGMGWVCVNILLCSLAGITHLHVYKDMPNITPLKGKKWGTGMVEGPLFQNLSFRPSVCLDMSPPFCFSSGPSGRGRMV